MEPRNSELGIGLNRVAKVIDCSIPVSCIEAHQPTFIMRFGPVPSQPNRFVHVGQGAVVLSQPSLRPAPIQEGGCANVVWLVLRIDYLSTTGYRPLNGAILLVLTIRNALLALLLRDGWGRRRHQEGEKYRGKTQGLCPRSRDSRNYGC
ncbi:hypothetical protein GWK15_16365 [Roseomonas oryzicola]|uniref:Uncharacterized protein n=1 Tax=Neoroseomonas oryzicola TaxID=535904 RepID=A0A9X9WDF3_9PROT|nr:hypothetical protein [Neoroseomonas oryzicola]MBR0658363.1 hypothetical protein [Neoroseomonas oryzicola]NKE18528.1 hypothetical protein [Neoroseomonas oryzicola]